MLLVCSPVAYIGISRYAWSMQGDVDRVAAILRALGHPTRLGIARRLAVEGEICACDFTDHFGVSQPTISGHLKALRTTGVVLDPPPRNPDLLFPRPERCPLARRAGRDPGRLAAGGMMPMTSPPSSSPRGDPRCFGPIPTSQTSSLRSSIADRQPDAPEFAEGVPATAADRLVLQPLAHAIASCESGGCGPTRSLGARPCDRRRARRNRSQVA